MTDIALDEKALAETQVEFDNVPPGFVEAIIAAWSRRTSPSQVAPANPAQVTDAQLYAANNAFLAEISSGRGTIGPVTITGVNFDIAMRAALTAAIGAGCETVPAEWYAIANKQRNEAKKNASHWHGEIEAIGSMLGIGSPDAGEVPAAVQAAIGAGGQAVAASWDIEATAEEIARGLSAVKGGRYHGPAYSAAKAGALEAFERILSALSQPHPADERVVEALDKELRERLEFGATNIGAAIEPEECRVILAALSAKEGR